MSQGLRYPNRVLLGALGLGICADLLFYGQWIGVSVALFVVVSLGVLAGLGLGEAVAESRHVRFGEDIGDRKNHGRSQLHC